MKHSVILEIDREGEGFPIAPRCFFTFIAPTMDGELEAEYGKVVRLRVTDTTLEIHRERGGYQYKLEDLK